MSEKLNLFNQKQIKTNLPEIRVGDTVRVYLKIREKPKTSEKKKQEVEEKERIQVFEGIVIARRGKKEISATFTVRKEIGGLGVERIFPLHSPLIEKIEIVKKGKVRRAKLYYLRKAKGKRAKIKERV